MLITDVKNIFFTYYPEFGVEIIDEIVEQSLLYDFYGELLTENRRRIYEAVVFSDLSISEVAEQEGITRQGVFDMLKRSQKALLKYEEKLGLLQKFNETRRLLACIRTLTYKTDSDGINAGLLQRIRSLADEIEAKL